MDKFNDKDNISVDKSGIPSLAQNMVSLFTKSVSINLNGLINSASIFAESISKIVQSSSTIVESFSHVLSGLSLTPLALGETMDGLFILMHLGNFSLLFRQINQMQTL